MKKNKFFGIILFTFPILLFFLFTFIVLAATGGIEPSTDCSENLSCAKLDSDNSNINFGCGSCGVCHICLAGAGKRRA